MGWMCTNALLQTACEDLGYVGAPGYSESRATPFGAGDQEWIDKGDWLALAKKAGAQRLFFVDNSPVVVFAECDKDDPESLRRLFNRIWCMARPRFLFLARPGEIAAYDLDQAPVRTAREWASRGALAVARQVKEVAEKLKSFRREAIESGQLFEEKRFGEPMNRADKAIIRDLKTVRWQLATSGLTGDKLKYAHSLIGRSIFIRYLEDREVLVRDDFYDVAKGHRSWTELLEEHTRRQGMDCANKPCFYPRVLEDKGFTYALFRKLADYFNGDIFPDIEEEEKYVDGTHLKLIQDLLYGDPGPQKKLFFHAYEFQIVPIELISSIYEEFYHDVGLSGESPEPRGTAVAQGAYYTPPALVEFLLSRVLTSERLGSNPQILDPACGSGIFLVESFRRIVRYRVLKQGRRLRFDELVKIVRDQLAGMDLNREAIRVSAFSLYLSMLHYLDPPSIREQLLRGHILPFLVCTGQSTDKRHLNILLHANAFSTEYIASKPELAERFSSSCADVIVGNPPWGSPPTKDEDAVAANSVALQWCKANAKPVGQKERSQVFIWRALDLVRPTGVVALLAHINVFLMRHDNSEAFRRAWLSEATVDSVFNLAHVRTVFFQRAIAPFVTVVFHPTDGLGQPPIPYWSARKISIIGALQTVLFRKIDLRVIRGDEDLGSASLWKTYAWGNHRDKALIQYLARDDALGDLSTVRLHGRGYEAGTACSSDWLSKYKALPASEIHRYRRPDLTQLFGIPPRVRRRGKEEIFKGERILIKRGIEQRTRPKGQIVARLVSEEFAFPNSIYGVKLVEGDHSDYQCVLGILWSSLARYYLLLTSYDWGVWHDEIRLEDELLDLPIRLPEDSALRARITETVSKLQALDVGERDLQDPDAPSKRQLAEKRKCLEAELDEAIYSLYGLGAAEVDLVRDMCDTNLPHYYHGDASDGAEPIVEGGQSISGTVGTIRELPEGIGDYLRVFMESWHPYLAENTEFRYGVYLPAEGNSMVAAVFSVQEKGTQRYAPSSQEIVSWDSLLARLGSSLTDEFGSRSIYIEGLVRAVVGGEVLIIKRNERYLWTRSAAREDAEATLVDAMAGKRLRRSWETA